MQNPIPSTLTAEYVFSSFLPYRQALFLGRWMMGLARIQRAIRRGRRVEEGVATAAWTAAASLNPDIKHPCMDEEEVRQQQEREEEFRSLSEDERGARIEEDAAELRRKIEEGELDIWDDSIVYADTAKAGDFLQDSIAYLDSKIKVACNPRESFFEGFVPEMIDILRGGSIQDLGAGLAVLGAWDYGRMYHEGEPPYRIVFSEQVAEMLGIDRKLEEARLSNMSPMHPETRRRVDFYCHLAKRRWPELKGVIKVIKNTVY